MNGDIDFNGQHFTFWKVAPSDTVELNGQFDQDAWWKATVGSIQYIANPAVKRHDGKNSFTQPERHLTAHALHSAVLQPRRKVRIWNQFTKEEGEEWLLDQPIWLLVPAMKSHEAMPQKPEAGDHYACYRVVEATQFQVNNVRLHDQFDQHPERVQQLEPVALCVPVMKRHENQDNPDTPLLDPNTHLALYTIYPPRAMKTQAYTADQFTMQAIEATEREMVAVPTRKRWEQG